MAKTWPSDEDVRASWGLRIRRRRRELELTQAELGAQVGVVTTAVSAWEHGLSIPTPVRQALIARALQCNPVELFPHPVPEEDGPDA